MPHQPCAGVVQRDAVGSLKHLDHRAVAVDLDDTAIPFGPVFEPDGDRFFIGSVFHTFERDQGAVDLLDPEIFNNHKPHAFLGSPAGRGVRAEYKHAADQASARMVS